MRKGERSEEGREKHEMRGGMSAWANNQLVTRSPIIRNEEAKNHPTNWNTGNGRRRKPARGEKQELLKGKELKIEEVINLSIMLIIGKKGMKKNNLYKDM